jgi:hypothetical protein
VGTSRREERNGQGEKGLNMIIHMDENEIIESELF